MNFSLLLAAIVYLYCLLVLASQVAFRDFAFHIYRTNCLFHRCSFGFAKLFSLFPFQYKGII